MVLWNGGTSVWARGSTVTSLLGCLVTIPSAFATECGLVTTGTSCHSISWYSSCSFSVASSKLFWAIFCGSCHPLEALKKWLHADDVLNIRFPSPVADITSWFIGVVFLKTLKGSNQRRRSFSDSTTFLNGLYANTKYPGWKDTFRWRESYLSFCWIFTSSILIFTTSLAADHSASRWPA